MVEGGGFEPPKLETADLQSALVGRLSIPPAQIKQGIFTESPTHVNLYFYIFAFNLLKPKPNHFITKKFIP